MRSCEEFELLASLAVDGEASGAEQAELAAHLETCPACRAYFADIQKIHGAFVRAEIVVPEGLAARVMDRVRETEQERPKEPERKVIPFPHWKRWAALAACCALAALSLWVARWNGSTKDAMVSMDDMPRDLMDARMVEAETAAQEPAFFNLDDGEAVEDTASPDEAPLPMPEEYEELAKSVARDGAGEGQYQPLPEDNQPGQEAAIAAGTPPAAAMGSLEPSAPDVFDRDSMNPADAPEAPETLEEKEELDAAMEPEPEEPLEVDPVEVIGVPEPGVLTAFGSTAQEWVERVLGLEWAGGGSYPLTAEQYGDLLRTLDEAGEPYRIEPGEGYCLMAE